MIVNSERTIALTCPACQGFQKHTFSLFSISKKPLQLVCSCGFSQGHLRRINKHFEVDVLSVEGDRARVLIPKGQFFAMPLVDLLSPLNGESLGYLGDPAHVQDRILDGQSAFSLTSDDFANPEVMRDILQLLEDQPRGTIFAVNANIRPSGSMSTLIRSSWSVPIAEAWFRLRLAPAGIKKDWPKWDRLLWNHARRIFWESGLSP